ncbi:methylenetetrahydrofolate reductase C-terminal domain-containing protein [Natranaerofaba carboxydovora]|uniref:methylenetetrahydrofolate reductase C-terminal domain-containing protein n=1 Tax=Natranaerofaba carboxydovora TaxID=2742683 RepID=UPI001F147C27|nr:methylenetetrahydrofolate reductase C-terminal domain-containing protein [Natranaerofaba carboxydovora]UMZ75352.1 hypothetical protein ACONDI_02975 [Natranaerofaba carboxydovora]
MIIAERKPLDRILENIKPFKKVLVLGCRTCVAVCLAGGEKEAEALARTIDLKNKKEGNDVQVDFASLERQCEFEFVEDFEQELKDYDVILSMACGAGPQTIVAKYPEVKVLPAVNTTFIGMPKEQGVWVEQCVACGDCELDKTMGICPIAKCSKSMMNGPCGGSQDGKCEIDKELDCGWHLIYERLKELGMSDRMNTIEPPKDWSTSHSGGPRKQVREDVELES